LIPVDSTQNDAGARLVYRAFVRVALLSLLVLIAACAGSGMAPMLEYDTDAGTISDCGDAADCQPCEGCVPELFVKLPSGVSATQPKGASVPLLINAARTSPDGRTSVPMQGSVDLFLAPDTKATLSPASVTLGADGTGRATLKLCSSGTSCVAGDSFNVQGVIGTTVSDELAITLGGGGTVDAGPRDAGHPVDAGHPDAGRVDAGVADAGHPDAGHPDAGNPDAGPHGCYADVDCGHRRCQLSTGQCVQCLLASDCGANATCTANACVSTGVCTIAAGSVPLASSTTLNVTANSLTCTGGLASGTPNCTGAVTVTRDACFDGFVLTVNAGTGAVRLRLQSDGTRWKAGAQLVGGPVLGGNMTERGLSSPAILPPPAGTHLMLSFFTEGPVGAVTFFANGNALSNW
jgi:hypothetical protein